MEIDVCDRCCLIWFDETESVRLAGPGVADLVRVIHGAMSGGAIHPHAASLARLQRCPVCGAELRPVSNVSRFGRTAQLQCPRGHGYYQTYILYLAEKGFVRPLAWADIQALSAKGKELFCANCGASMPARPHDACPCCRSAVGVIDPARLAQAIDLADVAGMEDAPAIRREQARCAQCGGPLDPARDQRCPHCHALVLRSDTAQALAAVESVEAAVRSNYARQSPQVSRAKLRDAALTGQPLSAGTPRWRSFKWRTVAGLLVFTATMAAYQAYRPASGPLRSPDDADYPARMAREAPLLSYAGMFPAAVPACDRAAAGRSEVKLRQIIIAPGFDASPAPVASAGAMRAAYARAGRARQEWLAGASYEALLDRYATPDTFERGIPAGFQGRGELQPQVAQAAFCLAVDGVSEVILAADGFHVIQVSEAR